jgi:hypothetical protein
MVEQNNHNVPLGASRNGFLEPSTAPTVNGTPRSTRAGATSKGARKKANHGVQAGPPAAELKTDYGRAFQKACRAAKAALADGSAAAAAAAQQLFAVLERGLPTPGQTPGQTLGHGEFAEVDRVLHDVLPPAGNRGPAGALCAILRVWACGVGSELSWVAEQRRNGGTEADAAFRIAAPFLAQQLDWPPETRWQGFALLGRVLAAQGRHPDLGELCVSRPLEPRGQLMFAIAVVGGQSTDQEIRVVDLLKSACDFSTDEAEDALRLWAANDASVGVILRAAKAEVLDRRPKAFTERTERPTLDWYETLKLRRPSARPPGALEPPRLWPCAPPAASIALLGESKVGKSTAIGALLEARTHFEPDARGQVLHPKLAELRRGGEWSKTAAFEPLAVVFRPGTDGKMPLTLFDYAGEALSPSVFGQSTEMELEDGLAHAQGLLIYLDDRSLHEGAEAEAHAKRLSSRLLDILRELQVTPGAPPRAIAIAVNKSDLLLGTDGSAKLAALERHGVLGPKFDSLEIGRADIGAQILEVALAQPHNALYHEQQLVLRRLCSRFEHLFEQLVASGAEFEVFFVESTPAGGDSATEPIRWVAELLHRTYRREVPHAYAAAVAPQRKLCRDLAEVLHTDEEFQRAIEEQSRQLDQVLRKLAAHSSKPLVGPLLRARANRMQKASESLQARAATLLARAAVLVGTAPESLDGPQAEKRELVGLWLAAATRELKRLEELAVRPHSRRVKP